MAGEIGQTRSAAPAQAQAQAWRLALLCANYFADTTAISRAGGSPMQPLLMTAILEANQAPINQDPALQLAYGDLGRAAPDELRRPVSVNALAESLRLPFETVRRHVGKLARQGLVVIGPRGVYVPQAAVTSAAYNAVQAARYDRLKRFHAEALARGLAAAAAAPPVVAPAPDAAPIRAADRAIAEYMLRLSDRLMNLAGGVIDGVVLLETARANLAGLSEAELAAPNLARRLTPVRTLELSRRLGLPRETTRRHVQALEARGFCVSGRWGVSVAVPTEPGPRLAALSALAAANLMDVQRMFARLDQLGVTARWRAGAD